MAGFGRGSGRKKTTAQKRSRPTDDVSEYDESDQEYTEFEYWNNNVEVAKASKKGKEFAIASEPGKKNPPRGKKKLGGIEIREPTFGQAPYQGVDDDYMNIDSKRIGVFCQRSCIGERHVAVQSLLEESPEFALLFEQGHLEQICDFSEQTGYCMQLVRTFYLCGGHLRDDLGGPLEFTTTVRGTQMKITPTTVAAARDKARI